MHGEQDAGDVCAPQRVPQSGLQVQMHVEEGGRRIQRAGAQGAGQVVFLCLDLSRYYSRFVDFLGEGLADDDGDGDEDEDPNGSYSSSRRLCRVGVAACPVTSQHVSDAPLETLDLATSQVTSSVASRACPTCRAGCGGGSQSPRPPLQRGGRCLSRSSGPLCLHPLDSASAEGTHCRLKEALTPV